MEGKKARAPERSKKASQRNAPGAFLRIPAVDFLPSDLHVCEEYHPNMSRIKNT